MLILKCIRIRIEKLKAYSVQIYYRTKPHRFTVLSSDEKLGVGLGTRLHKAHNPDRCCKQVTPCKQCTG